MKRKAQPTGDFSKLFSTPAQQAASHVRWYQERLKGNGITWGIPCIDRKVIPARPPEVISVLGRPGHGKSSVLAMLAMKHAERIKDTTDANGRKNVAVYVTWETGVEDLVTMFYATEGQFSASDVYWGRVPLAEIQKVAMKWPARTGNSLYIVGHGMNTTGLKLPRMTTEAVYSAIERMGEDYNVTPTALFMDYLQLIPIERGSSRAEQVEEAMTNVKELARRIGCIAFLGVQAKREVDLRDWKVPQKLDAWYSSATEHTSDKMFGIWRPWLTDRDKGYIKMRMDDGQERAVRVTPELCILEMTKQRGGEGVARWVLNFAPQYLRIAEMELVKAAPPQR